MNFKYPPLLKQLLVVAMVAFSAAAVRAQLVITYAENPNDYNTRLSGTQVYRFNNLSTGVNNNVSWAGVGTFDRLFIKNNDYFGGAVDPAGSGPRRYSVQSPGTVVSTTFTLSTPSAYFGFWWSAGDVNNVVQFFNGATKVAEFKTSTLLNVIAGDPSYKGNPENRNWNSSQSYAFINFFAMDGVTWDKIVFSNAVGGTAFESDNYTTRVTAYNPTTDGPMPGKVLGTFGPDGQVPEPSTALLSVLALPLLMRRKRAA